FWQPFGHIVSPVTQALQSVPAALHPDGQVVGVLTQAALASHIAAEVLTPFVHDWAAPHAVPTALLPVAMQTELPVEHEVAPILQRPDGVPATTVLHPH